MDGGKTDAEDGPQPADDRGMAAGPSSEPTPDRVERLAEDALAAGRRITESETGRRMVDAADTAFEKAGALSRKAADSQLGDTARKLWNTPLGRNVGTGAAVGAAVGVFVPFVGPIIGAVAGGGLGYLRTLAKKR